MIKQQIKQSNNWNRIHCFLYWAQFINATKHAMPFEWLGIWISTNFHQTASKQTQISEISNVNSSTTSYHLVFRDFQRQLFINIKADSNFSRCLSLILHQMWRDHQHLVSFVSRWDSHWSANVTKSNNALSFKNKSASATKSLYSKASEMIIVSIVALWQRAATSELIVIYFASHIDVLDHEGADE